MGTLLSKKYTSDAKTFKRKAHFRKKKIFSFLRGKKRHCNSVKRHVKHEECMYVVKKR